MHPQLQRAARCEVLELNVRSDSVHLVVMIPPKVAVSEYVGTVKERTALRVFSRFRHLKRRPYWGKHFWTKGYCANTVGLDAEMIRSYVKYREKHERHMEQGKLDY